jgi:hypothetical protein
VALSDSCFEFLEAVRTAARRLSAEIEDYPLPPYAYDEELRALRRASNDVVDAPWSAEAGSRLLQLATAVMTYHDTVPETPEAAKREAEMVNLVNILRAGLDTPDAEGVEGLVKNVVRDTPFTESAAVKLREMLPKLGKATYDVAVKVITDIASETAKKILGLHF